jgi:hypothetical protein
LLTRQAGYSGLAERPRYPGQEHDARPLSEDAARSRDMHQALDLR